MGGGVPQQVLPQPGMYMGSLEGKHGQHDLPWPAVDFYTGSTQVMAELGRRHLRSLQC